MDRLENPFLTVLRLPVKTSPIILMISINLHIICLFLPWLTGLEFEGKIILTSVPIVSFCFYLIKNKFYKIDQRVSELILNSDDKWHVKLKDDAVQHALLGHSLFVHPWLTIISLEYNNIRQHFIFTPKNIDETQFRRLRVRLRFQMDE